MANINPFIEGGVGGLEITDRFDSENRDPQVWAGAYKNNLFDLSGCREAFVVCDFYTNHVIFEVFGQESGKTTYDSIAFQPSIGVPVVIDVNKYSVCRVAISHGNVQGYAQCGGHITRKY